MSKIAFAVNLRRILSERSLTLTKVSLATGIPLSTLSEWTAGREPKVSVALIKLSQYLQISLDELITADCQNSKKEQPITFTVDIYLEGRKYKVRFDRVG